MAQSRNEGPAKAPYVPVKHQATNRKQWFEKKELADRMKAMRATLDAEIKTARDANYPREIAGSQTGVNLFSGRGCESGDSDGPNEVSDVV